MLPSYAGSRRSAMPLHRNTASRCHPFLDWVLLDTVVHMGRCRDNATTACVETSGRCRIEVSFLVSDPPALTRCVVDCPHLTYGNFFEEPPLIIGADGAFLLISVVFPKHPDRSDHTDLFIYNSGPRKPSLQLLPHPYPVGCISSQIGVLSCGDYCLVVVPGQGLDADGLVTLDIFSSETGLWSTKVASLASGVDRYYVQFEPTKVFAAGRGSLAFVDLRIGILLCDSLQGNPEVRLIQLPPLMPINIEKIGMGLYVSDTLPCLDKVRDVTCSDGWFRFIEMGFSQLHTSSTTPFNFQWQATMHKSKVGKNNWGWSQYNTVDSARLWPADSCYPYLFPEIYKNNELALNNVISLFPALDQKNSDIVYMMAKMEDADPNGWVLAINAKTKELEKVAPFSAGSLHLHRNYMQFAFPKHLNRDLGVCNTDGWKHNISKKYWTPLVLYVVSVLLAQRKFRLFEKYFTKGRPSRREVWSLLHGGVAAASAINVHIHQVAQYATSIGLGKAASDAEETFQRASKDIENLLLGYCRNDPTACGKAVRDKVNVAVGALDELLHTLPSSLLNTGRSMIPVYDESGDEESIAEKFACSVAVKFVNPYGIGIIDVMSCSG